MEARFFPGLFDLNINWIRSYFKLIPFANFRPNYTLYAENNKYIIKTADSFKEFFELFRLRFFSFKGDIFTRLSHLDIDEYDWSCDHIVIICKESNKVVGTYRLRPTTFTNKFYSQGEFNLNKLLKKEGEKLELGRACIHPKYRDGAVIDILWKGIGRYAKICNARYLFGCSSVKTLSPKEASRYYHYLQQQQALVEEEEVYPLEKFKKTLPPIAIYDIGDMYRELPPLLRAYLKAGAKFYGAPAFDHDFGCIDFFTVIDTESLNEQYKKRYF